MDHTKGWITAAKILGGLALLIVFIGGSWYFYFRLQVRPNSSAGARTFTSLELDAMTLPRSKTPPPSYDEATRDQPDCHQNFNNFAPDTDQSNSGNTVQYNNEASGRQNQSKVRSKNDHQSSIQDNSGIYISNNGSICVVHGNVINFIKNNYDMNMETDGEKCDYKENGSSIDNSAGSTSQDFCEVPTNVVENVGVCNNENDNGVKNENNSKLEIVGNGECSKKLAGGNNDSIGREEKLEKCEDDVSSTSNSDAANGGQDCREDVVSVNSTQYSSASGDSGVPKE